MRPSFFRRFARYYADARADPFFPAGPVSAFFFVCRNWRWLENLYSADW